MSPKTYQKLNRPLGNEAEATAALCAFFKALYFLRVKHKIADLNVTTRVLVKEEDKENPVVSNIHIGDSRQAAPMTAYAHGHHRKKSEIDEADAYVIGREHAEQELLAKAEKECPGSSPSPSQTTVDNSTPCSTTSPSTDAAQSDSGPTPPAQ